MRKSDFRLPVLAGIAFALFFVFTERACVDSVFWPVFISQCVSLGVLGAGIFGCHCWERPERSLLPAIASIGVLNVTGTLLFALATHVGRLDVASILAALYPVATVLLARWVLKEQLEGRQWLGVGIALGAIVLLVS